MDFKKLLGEAFPVIEKVAPALAAAIGSPLAGSAAIFALNIIANAFNVAPKDLHTLPDTITSNPNAEVILKDLHDNFGQYFSPAYATLQTTSSILRPVSLDMEIKAHWGDIADGKLLD